MLKSIWYLLSNADLLCETILGMVIISVNQNKTDISPARQDLSSAK